MPKVFVSLLNFFDRSHDLRITAPFVTSNLRLPANFLLPLFLQISGRYSRQIHNLKRQLDVLVKRFYDYRGMSVQAPHVEFLFLSFNYTILSHYLTTQSQHMSRAMTVIIS